MSTIYDLLTGEKISAVTTTQLNTATGRTYADRDNVAFWRDVLTVEAAMKTRTMPHGLAIPEASGISSVTVADSASGTIKPTGTEVWQIVGIDLDNCSLGLTDGGSVVPLANERTLSNMIITPTLYLAFVNASGSEQTPSIGYNKLSL